MSRSRESGFALAAALWVLVVVGALAGSYLAESHHVVRTSANRTVELQARQGALAGLEKARNALERLHILGLDPAARFGAESGQQIAQVWNHLDSAFVEIGSECLGDACFRLEVRDPATALNVNLAGEAQLRRLFLAVGVEFRRADIAAQSIADWIDPDDLHRARGAEREHYQREGQSDAPRNGPLPDISELRRVRGVDDRLFEAVAPYLSIQGDGRINLNAAPLPVLAALPGFGTEVLRTISASRRLGLSFNNVFELADYLSPLGRSELQADVGRLNRLLIFEPRQIEVTSAGRYRNGRPVVLMRALYERSGERLLLVERSRHDL